MCTMASLPRSTRTLRRPSAGEPHIQPCASEHAAAHHTMHNIKKSFPRDERRQDQQVTLLFLSFRYADVMVHRLLGACLGIYPLPDELAATAGVSTVISLSLSPPHTHRAPLTPCSNPRLPATLILICLFIFNGFFNPCLDLPFSFSSVFFVSPSNPNLDLPFHFHRFSLFPP